MQKEAMGKWKRKRKRRIERDKKRQKEAMEKRRGRRKRRIEKEKKMQKESMGKEKRETETTYTYICKTKGMDGMIQRHHSSSRWY
ncbi:hypothetical protein Pmani_013935 [Petrolisthes manimaculis]|uniref:Uncharacterized protein n=1 Tax=Petrolisthes manimaculis TaxID=1843537 RepID=A0AAE1PWI9_9EUCA|nr:hypothetical protein Pmani_013935 [Petrolisthes manimaculis]